MHSHELLALIAIATRRSMVPWKAGHRRPSLRVDLRKYLHG